MGKVCGGGVATVFLWTFTLLLSFCFLFGCASAQGRYSGSETGVGAGVGGGGGGGGGGGAGVGGRSSHIRRELNHCWRRYDGYNKNTVPGQKTELMRPFGVLCTFKCTILLYTKFTKCEFIYDYKLSCYLFTSLPDCLSLKCTFLDYISSF